jgi:hypothetical protein
MYRSKAARSAVVADAFAGGPAAGAGSYGPGMLPALTSSRYSECMPIFVNESELLRTWRLLRTDNLIRLRFFSLIGIRR